MSRLARTTVLAVLAACAWLVPHAALAAPLTIDVSEAQRVTIAGSSPSLREAIAQLCAAAGVELRGWQAEDRAFTARIEDEPLSRVLERLLRGETYMLGVRQGAGGAPLVKWVRVMGDAQDASAYAGHTAAVPAEPPPPPAPALDPYFGVSSSVTAAALSEPDAAKRDAAVQEIVRHFSENPTAIDQLLSRDNTETVSEVGDSEHAIALFQSIQGTQTDDATRWRIEGVIRSLRFKQQRAHPKRDFFSGGLRP